MPDFRLVINCLFVRGQKGRFHSSYKPGMEGTNRMPRKRLEICLRVSRRCIAVERYSRRSSQDHKASTIRQIGRDERSWTSSIKLLFCGQTYGDPSAHGCGGHVEFAEETHENTWGQHHAVVDLELRSENYRRRRSLGHTYWNTRKWSSHTYVDVFFGKL